MAEDTERQIAEKIKKSKLFALKLDESTDIQNNSILLTYVRYIDHDESDMKEDILSVSEFKLSVHHPGVFTKLNKMVFTSQTHLLFLYLMYYSGFKEFLTCFDSLLSHHQALT